MRDAADVPSSVEAELALFAAIIEDNSQLDNIDLAPSDFYEPVHVEIFEACQDLRRQGLMINLANLKGDMPGLLFGDGRDIVGYLRDFTLGPQRPSAADLARTITEMSARRRMKRIAASLDESATNYRCKPADACAEAWRSLDAIATSSRPAIKTMWTLSQIHEDRIRALRHRNEAEAMQSGLKSLDKVTGGFRRGEYWLLAGRPSMGKSCVAISLALGACRAGRGVLIHSLEMTVEQLGYRTISEMAHRGLLRKPYSELMSGDGVDSDVVDRLERLTTGEPVQNLDVNIDVRSSLLVSQIATSVRKHKSRNPSLGLVIIDHIGKVNASPRYAGNRNNELTEISGLLCEIAKAEDVCVLALSQLSRAVENRDDKRPNLADLRDSGSLEQDANVVLFAYRDAYYLERAKYEVGTPEETLRRVELERKRNELEINVAKNRNGETRTVPLYVDMAVNFICDLDKNQHGF